MHPIIVCGFPGIGKTHACFNMKDFRLLDLDSSLFTQDPAWTFPEDYIKALDEVIGWPGEPDFIFMSTHAETRQELADNQLPYVNVYPAPDRKEEVIERIKEREAKKQYGNAELADIVAANFDNWIEDLEKDKNATRTYQLQHGEFLADKLRTIKEENKR